MVRATRPLRDVHARFFGRFLRPWPLEFPLRCENAKKRTLEKWDAGLLHPGRHGPSRPDLKKSGRSLGAPCGSPAPPKANPCRRPGPGRADQPVPDRPASPGWPASHPGPGIDQPDRDPPNGPNPFARREKPPQSGGFTTSKRHFFWERIELKFLSQKKCRLFVVKPPDCGDFSRRANGFGPLGGSRSG